MITHVVLFKLAAPVEQNAHDVIDRLRAMEGVVAGLGSIRVGRDVNRGPRAYDVCLITTHEDEAALATYQADAHHGEVKAFIGERAVASAVVDFASE